MAKEKFSREQNEALGKIKYLPAKFSLLGQWLEKKEISPSLYNITINRMINKAVRSTKPTVEITEKIGCRCTVESDIQILTDKLRSNLNNYLAHRNKDEVKIADKDVLLFANYAEQLSYLRNKVDRMLIVGLRYPDEKLNKIAENIILRHKVNRKIQYVDATFWLLLWSDDNFVPLNAVRLMLDKTDDGDGVELATCFSRSLIKDLIPLIEFQKKKEELWFLWARSLKKGEWHKKEVDRALKRIIWFNQLLKVAKEKLNF